MSYTTTMILKPTTDVRKYLMEAHGVVPFAVAKQLLLEIRASKTNQIHVPDKVNEKSIAGLVDAFVMIQANKTAFNARVPSAQPKPSAQPRVSAQPKPSAQPRVSATTMLNGGVTRDRSLIVDALIMTGVNVDYNMSVPTLVSQVSALKDANVRSRLNITISDLRTAWLAMSGTGKKDGGPALNAIEPIVTAMIIAVYNSVANDDAVDDTADSAKPTIAALQKQMQQMLAAQTC